MITSDTEHSIGTICSLHNFQQPWRKWKKKKHWLLQGGNKSNHQKHTNHQRTKGNSTFWHCIGKTSTAQTNRTHCAGVHREVTLKLSSSLSNHQPSPNLVSGKTMRLFVCFFNATNPWQQFYALLLLCLCIYLWPQLAWTGLGPTATPLQSRMYCKQPWGGGFWVGVFFRSFTTSFSMGIWRVQINSTTEGEQKW